MLHVLATDLLNSLTAGIAVLDANGIIVAVNDEWKRFARENGGDDKEFYVGTNYLSICENAGQSNENKIAVMVSDGIHDLLNGKRNDFVVEYPCHSPDKQRWFIVHMTRFTHDEASYIVVVHENITARKLADENIRESIANYQEKTNGSKVNVTVSAGVAEILSHDDTLERLIQRADQALYEARNAGRNCSRVFSPELSR